MKERIEGNPEICHGKPVIRSTRIMVRSIAGSFANGESVQDILRYYPELTAENIEAATAYAIELVDDAQLSIKSTGWSKYFPIRTFRTPSPTVFTNK